MSLELENENGNMSAAMAVVGDSQEIGNLQNYNIQTSHRCIQHFRKRTQIPYQN